MVRYVLLLLLRPELKGDTDASILDGVKISKFSKKSAKSVQLLTAKHFQTQLTKKVREI
jgi:hypothetical protein